MSETKKNGPIGSTAPHIIDPFNDKTPNEVKSAIKQRSRQRKKMEQRTIVDVVAEAINPRRRRP